MEQCDRGSSAPEDVLRSLSESQAGSGRHKCSNCAYQFGFEDGRVNLLQVSSDGGHDGFPDLDYESITVLEGSCRWIKHFRRERNSKIVAAKKNQVIQATGSLKCEVCEFDFSERYGTLGEGFCEVHHKTALSTLEEETKTRLEDLAIVCSNCHRMIHRIRPMISVEDLRTTLAQTESTQSS